ncbi:MAG: Xaa-Pro peptidase family protein [Bacillota bacterium]|jgi:Xaa-Pro aminopeptidase|nr:Xaa-Pro peptidase family protein [Bacillota bacterium]HHT89948.1 aminopeptidase P family protein [Bacillota bacterium]
MSKFPVIPVEEFALRRRNLQQEARAAGLDLLVIFSNDRATAGPAHVRYVTDFATHFESSCCLIPAQGESVLVTGPEAEALAQLTAKIDKIVIAEEFKHPEQDHPFAKMSNFPEIISKMTPALGHKVKRVGIIGQELMDVALYSLLAEHYELSSVDPIMYKYRAVKSASELEVIKYVFEVAEVGFQAAVEAAGVGVAEFEIAAAAEHAMRLMGTEGTGIDTIVGAGPNARPIVVRATHRKVERGDTLGVTVIPRYQGYHGAVGRPISVGRPSPELAEAVDLAVEAQNAVLKALKPGAIGREVEQKAREVMATKGLEKYFAYVGVHTVGLVEFEPPIFHAASDVQIQADMIVSVDIPCFLTPFGGFRVEDGYHVTKDGPKPLSFTQAGLIQI